GGGAGKKLKEEFEVLKRRNDFFYANQSDQNVGHGDAHAAVAFGLDNADGAGFGDGEVSAADADPDAQKTIAKISAGGGGKVFRRVGEPGKAHGAAEDFSNLKTVFMQRGDDDVRRLIVT